MMPIMTYFDKITQSESVQNFLKTVYALQVDDQRVATNALADALNVAASSVTDMAQRLVNAGLVDYQKYQGVLLTIAGRTVALKIVRRHRLIELFLVRELGYALSEVHDEAESLEHAVSTRFIDALAHKLGDPDFDPHGDPIPTEQGTITERVLQPLNSWPLNQAACVAQIKADNRTLVEHILERGFTLNACVTVLAKDPFHGPLTVLVNGVSRIIGHQAAECIFVEAEDEHAQPA